MVDDVKNYISKSNETNTTKLFNAMLDRLWEQNTSINQNTNSKSVNTNWSIKNVVENFLNSVMLHYNILLSFGFLVYVVTIYHLLKLSL